MKISLSILQKELRRIHIKSEIRGNASLELEGLQLFTGDPAIIKKNMIYPAFPGTAGLDWTAWDTCGVREDSSEEKRAAEDGSREGKSAENRSEEGKPGGNPSDEEDSSKKSAKKNGVKKNGLEICLLIAKDDIRNLSFSSYNNGVSFLIITDSSVSLPQACNRIMEIFSRYNEMERRILELLAGDSDMQKLVNLLADFYGNPVYSIDASYNLLAINEDPELPYISRTFKRLKEHGYMPLNTILSLMESEEWKMANPGGKTIYMDIPQFYCPFLRCEYRVENVLQAYLFVIGINKRFLPGDEELLDLWSVYIRLFFSRHLERVSFSGFYHEHFFHDVMEGTLTYNQQIQEQLHPIGWHLNDLYSLLFISADQITNGSLRGILFQRLVHLNEGKPLYYHDDLYCVFHLEKVQDAEALKKELSVLLRQIGVRAGLSEPYRGFKRMKEFSGQAVHALEAGKHIAPDQYLYAYEDYVLPYLFHLLGTLPATDSFIHESVPFL
ncbi:MAG: hypothetical protein II627_03015, partial [Lachnospiraceae bacterium]|nr:hypothetical protein [Lachnospiraceae bacterium]